MPRSPMALWESESIYFTVRQACYFIAVGRRDESQVNELYNQRSRNIPESSKKCWLIQNVGKVHMMKLGCRTHAMLLQVYWHMKRLTLAQLQDRTGLQFTLLPRTHDKVKPFPRVNIGEVIVKEARQHDPNSPAPWLSRAPVVSGQSQVFCSTALSYSVAPTNSMLISVPETTISIFLRQH